MTQTMAILLLFLVVMIAVPVLGRCPPPDYEIRYQKFLRQHYHRGGMSVKDCNTAMSQRCLNKPCKEMNSFILDATTNQIQDVCDKAGTPLGEGNLRQSTQPFQVVTCKHSGGSSRPPCQYKGSKSTRYIVIGCDADKFPVHFEEGIIPE
ncbi:angiogenin-4-like [Lepisosteus oculatus]|nr:PREDICTED: angiogenin-4-like [Lepisosteus oculatus]